MSLSYFIFVSSVLLSALQCSSAVRFSAMLYPAPSMRKYHQPWRYVPFIQLPRTMQRRFMWKEMDETMDGMMGTVAKAARPIPPVYSPPMIRYRKQPFDFDVQPSKKLKYIIKKPPAPPPPPFKRMKLVKFGLPKQPPIPLFKQVPIPEAPVVLPASKSSTVIMPFMSEEDLRKIEKEQEKKVEIESKKSGEDIGGGVGIHEHSHQAHMDDDIVSGRINEFGADWLPMQGPLSTVQSFPVSKLHTKVEIFSTIPAPTALPLTLSRPLKTKSQYEVTEQSVEAESIKKEQAFKPSSYSFDFFSPTTTEGPNYPEHFLKSFSKSKDDFKPMRVKIPTTFETTTSTTQSSRRLPPKSSTEHPFKRYNLHRPKSSKLFFHRSTSEPETTKHTQTSPPTTVTARTTTTTTTTTTENSFKETLDLHESLKTTRESIRTTREPSTTTTKEPKKNPPEKVRTTRMNSEGRSKLRIKNVSQNEGLNKVLNQHRGSVKFGEKTKTS